MFAAGWLLLLCDTNVFNMKTKHKSQFFCAAASFFAWSVTACGLL